MKKFLKEFLFRGLICAAGGPVVLAIIYGILGAVGVAESLTPREVCLGIVTVMILAFVVAGSGVVYTIERLPTPTAALLHGAILYATYLLIYLINGWLLSQWKSVLIFTGCFMAGYALVWLIIYLCIRAKTKKLNQLLEKQA